METFIGVDETGGCQSPRHASTLANGSSTMVSFESHSGYSVPEAEGAHTRFKVELCLTPPSELSNERTTHDLETIGYATHEALPLTVFYRNHTSMDGKCQQRPTLDELHKGYDELEEDQEDGGAKEEDGTSLDVEVKSLPPVTKIKFGWVKGVLIPCLLNIWGVILFLRLPRLTGQAGVLCMTLIILMSASVTTITSLSVSAICTNGEVKGGGAYFLISRTLGPEFGGSIGIIFSLANAIAVALNVVGFSETLQNVFARSSLTMFDEVNDVRIIGLCMVVALLIVTLVGLDWVLKTQIFLLVLLVVSMLDSVVGAFTGSVIESRSELEAQGFTGFSASTLSDNLLPVLSAKDLITAFSIFFPAATGILAGLNISGDLKDPSSAVPKGTLAAVAITTSSYIILAWLLGSCAVKDAFGVQVISPSANVTLLSATVINITWPPALNTTATASPAAYFQVHKCKYGLLNDRQIMERFSLFGPLILVGIFAASLSSALAGLVGSPRTFQAVCRDKIFPGLHFFSRGSGPNDEPRRASILTFLISSAFIALGKLDLIAPMISNFFLMSYALVNYSVFAASLGRSPGWRPSFKFYNMWLSLFGCLLCVGIMFLINWWAALITLLIVVAVYKYVDFRKPQINWGSSGQAHRYIKALRLAHLLNKTEAHVKNFRPQCLVLTGSPFSRPSLTHFVSHMTKHVGLMICGKVVISDGRSMELSIQDDEKWLRERRIKAFVTAVSAPSLRNGAQCLMQCCGLGKLRPNILVLGYKAGWQEDGQDNVDEYVDILHDAFDAKMNVAVLRVPTNFSDSDYSDDESMKGEEEGCSDKADISNPRAAGFDARAGNGLVGPTGNEAPVDAEESELPSTPSTPMLKLRPEGSHKRIISSFRSKAKIPQAIEQKKRGFIDVWWLFDDGGLTVLLPYLISRSKNWSACSLRVFSPTSGRQLKSSQVSMASLLKKFRIDFADVVEVKGVNTMPGEESIETFRQMWEGELEDPIDKKTLQHIRLGELVRAHSRDANLVVLTMPIPRKRVTSSTLFMSWLETMSRDLSAPVLFIRGNQESVLTFYS